MKRISVVSIILIITMLLSYALADEFEIRGIKFGCTLEEVKQIETLKFDGLNEKGSALFKGTISGIDNSEIGFCFNEDGKLYSIFIDFDNKKGNLLLKARLSND